MAVPHEMLLHPELLSNEQLTHIIEQVSIEYFGASLQYNFVNKQLI